MIGDWFDPQEGAVQDAADQLEEARRQDATADALLLGRRTFEDFRAYWPVQTEGRPGSRPT